MRKKKIDILAAICLSALTCSAFGQEIKVGEKVPNVVLSNIIRHKKTSGKLITDFGDKPMIIDFWATWCSPCIAALPRLDSIKKAFSNNLNILLVTSESKDIADSFFKTRKSGNVSLPSVVSDNLLRKLFPASTIPHEIWIGSDGIVKAITGGEEITWSNVKAFVEGATLSLKPKSSQIVPPEISMAEMPLAAIDYKTSGMKDVMQYSYIGKSNRMVRNLLYPTIYDKKTNTTRTIMSNMGLRLLYQGAFGLDPTPGVIRRNTFVVNMNDSLFTIVEHDPKKRVEEQLRKSFSYDVIISGNNPKKICEIMKQDLDRYFGIESKIEKLKVDCYVLKRTSNEDKIVADGDIKRDSFKEGKFIFYRNMPWGFSINESLNLREHDLEFIDETGFERGKLVDFKVLKGWENLSDLNKELLKYDLRLTIEKRERDVITLTDAK